MSCGVGRRCGLDPALLWLWCRLVATAPIGPQAWELPYAPDAALKGQKDQNKQTNKQKKPYFWIQLHSDAGGSDFDIWILGWTQVSP